jgi:protein tyrosine phosphatase (PTP) superfamily phosphohydrolase (DUF442 family)
MSLIFQSPEPSVNGKRPGIYVGGKVDAKNRQKLIDRGITHILNMTPAKEVSIQAGVPNYFERDFVYKRIPVYDSVTSVTALRDAADEICQFISTALCRGSILVHCQRGVSRSVAAILLYLVRYVFNVYTRIVHCCRDYRVYSLEYFLLVALLSPVVSFEPLLQTHDT